MDQICYTPCGSQMVKYKRNNATNAWEAYHLYSLQTSHVFRGQASTKQQAYWFNRINHWEDQPNTATSTAKRHSQASGISFDLGLNRSQMPV